APAGVLEEPAVVVAAQAAVFHEAVRHVRAPVRTVPVDEAVVPAPVPEQREVLAEEPDRLYVLLLELRGARDRMPVTPQQFSHRRSPACFAQEAVSLITQHGSILARMRKTGKSWLIRSKSSSGGLLGDWDVWASARGRLQVPAEDGGAVGAADFLKADLLAAAVY